MDIVAAHAGPELEAVRTLLVEYTQGLDFHLGFQDFDGELEGLPGAYAPPAGRLLLARQGPESAGCVALRPLEPGIGEMKRMYVRSAYRGSGVGRALAEAVIAAARVAGYRAVRLDTVPGMVAANGLYESLGFRDTAPYRYNPLPGARYMELDLARQTQ